MLHRSQFWQRGLDKILDLFPSSLKLHIYVVFYYQAFILIIIKSHNNYWVNIFHNGVIPPFLNPWMLPQLLRTETVLEALDHEVSCIGADLTPRL